MLLLLTVLFLLLFLGVPIAYAIGISSFTYFGLYYPELIRVLPQKMYAGFNSYGLIALPLFVHMGYLMNDAGITDKIINFLMMIVGRLRGGMGLVNVGASMIFGGISGSAASDTASIGSILIPQMEKRGYSRAFASGITVSSSTMGIIIPPSIPVVLYAIVAQESVSDLFLGSAIPGIMIGLIQLAICFYIATKRKYPVENIKAGIYEVSKESVRSSYILIMPLVIVGVVVFGIATPTESAAIGVFYALTIGLLNKKINTKVFYRTLWKAGMVSSQIMVIIALSQLYIWVLTLEHIDEKLYNFMIQFANSPALFLLVLTIVVVLIGTFLDVTPAILLLTPLFLPIAKEIGVDPVTFGIVLISSLAIGTCTPPVGNCLNVCAAITKMSIGKIFQAAIPFLVANLIVVLMIIFLEDFMISFMIDLFSEQR